MNLYLKKALKGWYEISQNFSILDLSPNYTF